MKAQSQIVQFILFFLVGLSVFLALSDVYKTQLDIFGSTISQSSEVLTASYISENFIEERSCLSCDTINITINPQSPENVFLQVALSLSSLQIISYPNLQSTSSLMHNILFSVSGASGQATVGKPIILSFIKTQNILRVAQ